MKQVFPIFLFLMLAVNALGQNERDYIRRGNRLYRDTLFSKAQVQYQKATEYDNTSPQAHYNLGNSLLYQSKAEDAMKEYETAVQFEKNRVRKAQIFHNMGVLLQSAKQFDKALACYQNSLRNDPTNNATRYNYALCLYQLKKNGGQDNQDQQQDENGNDEKKEQQKEEQQKQDRQNDQKEEQKEQPKPDQMSKENAEQMLKAAMQDEKNTQEKVQRIQQQPQNKRLQKQW